MADDDRYLNELENPAVEHEERDVNAFAITRFGIGLTLTVIATLFLIWGLFNYFKSREEAEFGPAPVPAEGVNAAKLPPQPRLEEAPTIYLQEMRAAEEQLLSHYGWIDRDKGAVRVPIDRAMDILAQRGLPARTETPPPLGSPNNPTQSSGGPILQQPGGPLAPQLSGAAQPVQGTNP